MKIGRFAEYKNNIYSVSVISNVSVRLVSKDISDISKGFAEKTYPDYYQNKESLPKIYIKEVPYNEITSLYEMNYKVIYKGVKFNLSREETNGKLVIGTGDAKVAQKYGFERTDKYYYEKTIHADEADVVEEKRILQLNGKP